jgi:serine/threonine protein kinase/tetratricopeptide (TPR) repeat protein
MPTEAVNVRAIFDRALEITTAGDRAAYLDRACADLPDVRREVEALLKAHSDAGSFLESPAAEMAATIHSSAHSDFAGSQIGPYKLIEQIGEGGMGIVYMAQQTEPVKRLVAVKLIKAGMDSKQVLARFEAERQALALMDHPNIARVLDAGSTAPTDGGYPGRPYFVMDLVKGVPITKYCDEHRLTPRQRLELFIPVCQAVQHAHQKGVIHRDLKPSNVLVAPYDGRPVPKVIDFGVAKAAGQQLTDQTLVTGFGALVGTPEYMSPEQAELNNSDIDTRSDIYALGALLYELLAGTPPFSHSELEHAGMIEMLRVIREQEPAKPSTKLSAADGLPSLAANRGTEPAKLTKLMRGELDWIVMKALEKDRTRRYETANGFARDIERYLADEPVSACPPSASYRLRKFTRRNWRSVIAASLVLLSLIAGVIGTTAGMLTANRATEAERKAKNDALEQKRLADLAADKERQAKDREAQRADGERKAKIEAERNLAFAMKGNEILGSVFVNLDPKRIAESGRPLQDVLRQNLGKAVKELDGSAIGDPLAVATMQYTLGRSLHGLGEYNWSVKLLEKAFDTRRTKLGKDHLDTLITMNSLALSYQQAGRLDKAVQLLEEVLALRIARHDPYLGESVVSTGNLGLAYQAAGRLDKALPLFEETFALLKKKLGPEHPLTVNGMHDLACGYKVAGKLNLAVPLFEQTLKLWRKQLGSDHPLTLTCMNNLAATYYDAGKTDLALPLFKETFEIRKAKLGPDHPDTLHSMNYLALCYEKVRKLDMALPMFEQALTLEKVKFGDDHHETLHTMNNFARAYVSAGKAKLAIPLFQKVLASRKAEFGPNHPKTLSCMSNLAGCYRSADMPDLAVALWEETLRICKANRGDDDPDTLASMNGLALAYKSAKQYDKALPLYVQTLALSRAKLGPDNPATITRLSNLARAYVWAGKLEQALPLLDETLKLRTRKFGRDHLDTIDTMTFLAKAYKGAGRHDEAVPLFEESLALRRVKFPDDLETLSAMHDLAVAYHDTSRVEKALPLSQEALKLRREKLGDNDPDTLASMHNLAMCYQGAGKSNLALPLLEQTLRLRQATLGSENLDTLATQNALAFAYKDAGKADAALPLVQQTLKVRRAKLGDDHAYTIDAMNDLAIVYQAVGKQAEALRLFDEILERTKSIFGPENPQTLNSMHNLGVMYSKANRMDEGVRLLEKTLGLMEKTLGRQHVCSMSTVADLGNCYRKSGRLPEGIALLEEAYRASDTLPTLRWVGVELLNAYVEAGERDKLTGFEDRLLSQARKTLPKESPELASSLVEIGGAMLEQKQWADGEPLLRECLTIRQRTQPDLWTTFNAMSFLGRSLLGQKKYADAESLLVGGYEGMKRRETSIPPAGSARIPKALDCLIELYEATNKPVEAKRWREERAKYPAPK